MRAEPWRLYESLVRLTAHSWTQDGSVVEDARSGKEHQTPSSPRWSIAVEPIEYTELHRGHKETEEGRGGTALVGERGRQL